jgi:hypothetical protein
VYMAVVGPTVLLLGLWAVQRNEDSFAVVL